MVEIQILIPVADNAGVRFSPAYHAAFEAYVVDRFGGITRFPSTATGTWADAGVTYQDRLRVYGIAMRSLTQGALLGEVVDFAKSHYRQEAIFIRYLGLNEIL